MSWGGAAHGGVSHHDTLAYAEVVRKMRDNFDATFIQKSVLWVRPCSFEKSGSQVHERSSCCLQAEVFTGSGEAKSSTPVDFCT